MTFTSSGSPAFCNIAQPLFVETLLVQYLFLILDRLFLAEDVSPAIKYCNRAPSVEGCPDPEFAPISDALSKNSWHESPCEPEAIVSGLLLLQYGMRTVFNAFLKSLVRKFKKVMFNQLLTSESGYKVPDSVSHLKAVGSFCLISHVPSQLSS